MHSYFRTLLLLLFTCLLAMPVEVEAQQRRRTTTYNRYNRNRNRNRYRSRTRNRRRAAPVHPRGAHYAQRVAEFNRTRAIDSTCIVMLGNSLTENGRDWCTLLGDTTVCNRGISGDTAAGITERLNQILPGKPRAIFLMCGTNDISHGHSPEKVFDMCRNLIDSIRIASPTTRLFVQSLLPWNDSFHRWKTIEGRGDDVPVINDMLRNYCEEHELTFVNLYPKFTQGDTNQLVKAYTVDGLHLTPLGYQIWASQLMPYIEELNAVSEK